MRPAVEINVRVRGVNGTAGAQAEASRVYDLTTEGCAQAMKNPHSTTFQLTVNGPQLLTLGGVYRMTLTPVEPPGKEACS